MFASVAACSTEYSRPLASRDPSPSSGGRTSVATGGSGGFPTVPATGGATMTSTGGRPPAEPPADSVLTFVHGIVDAPRVLLCRTDGASAAAPGVGEPFPEGGLDYGTAFVFDSLDELELDRNPLSQVVIAGELELVEGLDCEQAVELARLEQARGGASDEGAGGASALEQESPALAGAPGESAGAGGAAGEGGAGGAAFPPVKPPRLRVGALPTVPAGTLSAGYSMLLVGTGCIGGPAFAVDGDTLACGELYRGEHPTLSATLARLGRKHMIGKLGLQVMHASLATTDVEVRVAPLTNSSELPLLLTAQHSYGELTPEPPRLDYPATSYGAGSLSWAVQVTQAGSVLYSEPWRVIIDRAKVQILDDRSYTLVLVGPAVGLPERFFWNEARVVLVDNDPTRAQ